MPMKASSGAKERERKADPVREAAMRVHADNDGNRGAERSDLRERQVHENDAALDDVHTKVGMNPGENEAGDKGREQEGQDFHSAFS